MGEQVQPMAFAPFKVSIPEGRRYWEDDSTGLFIKKGQVALVGSPKLIRSAELRFSLIRSQVLIVEGVVEFVFRGSLVRVEHGETKNLITVLSGPELEEKAAAQAAATLAASDAPSTTTAPQEPQKASELKPGVKGKKKEALKKETAADFGFDELVELDLPRGA